MLWRQVQMVLVPAVVIGGFLITPSMGGLISDAWDGFVGPFLITYWIGLGFANMWDVVRESVRGASPGTVAFTVAIVLVALLVLVGPASLFDDPWLFGVLIWPGIELALPYLRGQRTMPEGPDEGERTVE